MGLLSKLKKIHKKLDPIGSKIHSKTGGKIESKLSGKTPISKMLNGNTKKPTLNPTTSTTNSKGVTTKPMRVDGSKVMAGPAGAKSGVGRLQKSFNQRKK